MRRTNTFAVRSLTTEDEQSLRNLLDASVSLWNEINCERHEQYSSGAGIWDTEDYRKPQVGVLGLATARQAIWKYIAA